MGRNILRRTALIPKRTRGMKSFHFRVRAGKERFIPRGLPRKGVAGGDSGSRALPWGMIPFIPLIFLLSAGASSSWTFADSVPLEPKVTTGLTNFSYKPPFRPARQNHATGKAWSVDFDSAIKSRPELIYWIGQWNSSEGQIKLLTTFSRVFEFRISVDAIIRESGLPWELIAIPVVESNWRIEAVSSSGAAGPWQFLESSARGRNLIIDTWRDERRDVWRATEAAMKELDFYNRLYSDWLLAVASYNAGPTRIRRLREESGLSGYWDLLDEGILPPETRNYVPQVIAVAYITAHSGRFGLPISWDMPTRWTRIPLNRSIHLEKLIEATGADAELLRIANRELLYPVTPPPTMPYSLKVPIDDVEVTVKWLESLEYNGAPERFWRYSVRSGDTLSEIARRSGISLSELLSYNSHIRGEILRIGERLYLPGNHTMPEGAEKDELPDWNGRYHVKPGDSFWSIARIFGVAPERLAEANHRPLNGVLLAGSVLRVPVKKEEL